MAEWGLTVLIGKESVMSASAQVYPPAFVQALREETDRMLAAVMAAVNRAADGAWINGSEMPVRDLLGEYRRNVFEKALQMRVEAAEGAFSPGGPSGRARDGQQGPQRTQHPDGQ